ncbi:hypothetical protein FsymDg_2970 [Candidatus Protofrankia datiscae]|uniref:Uncharacterized protein n=1 Tax=Candidatus Protofrankia datiscae TaxID=2716812 RepID=F8AWR2_9ACTN|nr:hypothetical protein FsymDg_2970 [Candidatus Protofrankia datiscae]
MAHGGPGSVSRRTPRAADLRFGHLADATGTVGVRVPRPSGRQAALPSATGVAAGVTRSRTDARRRSLESCGMSTE